MRRKKKFFNLFGRFLPSSYCFPPFFWRSEFFCFFLQKETENIFILAHIFDNSILRVSSARLRKDKRCHIVDSKSIGFFPLSLLHFSFADRRVCCVTTNEWIPSLKLHIYFLPFFNANKKQIIATTTLTKNGMRAQSRLFHSFQQQNSLPVQWHIDPFMKRKKWVKKLNCEMKSECALRFVCILCMHMAIVSQCIHAERPPVHWKNIYRSRHACAIVNSEWALSVCAHKLGRRICVTKKKAKEFCSVSKIHFRFVGALTASWLNAKWVMSDVWWKCDDASDE